MDSNYSLSDVAAVTRGNDGFGFGDGGFFWIFALLLLPMMWGGGFGSWGNRGDGQPVTEAGLCNAMNFNNLENAVGRGFDQQTQFAFQNQRDMCTSTATLSSQIANSSSALERQLADCCCTTQRAIDGVNYNAAMNTASINANTTAGVQKILDAISGNRMADMQNQINQLQLQSALCGVVRYPLQTTYATNCNPFFGGGCGCNSCGNGNI